MLEGDAEPLLVDALDLGAQAEHEPTAREFGEVARRHGGDRWAAGKGQGDVRPDQDPRGADRRHRGLDEGGPGRLRNPRALEARLFHLRAEFAEPGEGTAHHHAELHGSGGYTLRMGGAALDDFDTAGYWRGSRELARRRCAITLSIFEAIEGLESMRRLKTHGVNPRVVTSVSAVTVAVLGPPSSREISPKKSPDPSLGPARSPTFTATVPSMMRKKPSPDCPSLARTAPWRWVTSFAERAILLSSGLESSSNRGTPANNFTASRLATWRSS